jgi:LPXTG-motif cell wall-anchored protein
MYGKGSTTAPAVLAAATTPATAAVLPQTGMNDASVMAVAIGAGLVAWAVAYAVQSKFSGR